MIDTVDVHTVDVYTINVNYRNNYSTWDAMTLPILAYTEDSLPQSTQANRFAATQQHNLALEVANRGDFSLEPYQTAGMPITTMQAYLMHEFHPLHPDADHRRQAVQHVESTLELAARLDAPRILTVCGFGHELADSPFERALDFFDQLANDAKQRGIEILIEPLSPKRAGALTYPNDVVRLLKTLDQPQVFALALDTGHLLDSGFELDQFFRHWNFPIRELQLKGKGSFPPDSTLPLAQWLQSLPQLPDVLCVEHRQPVSMEKFEQIVAWLHHSIEVLL
jgi:hypothetical protein